MVFVAHQAIEDHLLAVLILVQIPMEQGVCRAWLVVGIGKGQIERRIAHAVSVRIFVVWKFAEVKDLHRSLLSASNVDGYVALCIESHHDHQRR